MITEWAPGARVVKSISNIPTEWIGDFRAPAVVVAGDKRRTGVETNASFGQIAGSVAWVCEQIGHDNIARGFRNLGTGSFVPRNGVVLNADAGLKSLAITISQRDCRNWQPEDVTCHPGYTVEALTRRGIQEFKLV